MEKRANSRVAFQANATINADGRMVEGAVVDLSLKGMFCQTAETLPVGTKVKVTVVLSGSSTELDIELAGAVVRSVDEGIAVWFAEMELDAFVHLRNVVSYNAGDPDAIMAEFEAAAGAAE